MTDFTMEKGADGVAIVTWDVPGKSMNVLSMDGAAELDALIDGWNREMDGGEGGPDPAEETIPADETEALA